jgi:acetaldehyde dehydrogenase
MTPAPRWPVAIIGSDNIATDLMTKIQESNGPLTVAAIVGADGVEGVLKMPHFADIKLAFNTTSALRDNGIRTIDLTAAPVGPPCVPAVNLDDHLDAPHLSMITGVAQATVPIVAAVGTAGIVSYAETVSSIAAKSAGPETRANIDELIETTATALRVAGGAQRGKAVLILSPADPPAPMRNTVYCLVEGDADHRSIEEAILDMVDRVAAYAPGYRLKQGVQFEVFGPEDPLYIPETGKFVGTRVMVLLEVHDDIMISAAKATAERLVRHMTETAGATT